MPYNRRRWGRRPARAAVTSSTLILTRKSKCAECKQPLAIGTTVVRLRLKKRHQRACTSCGHNSAKLKYFHESCAPPDINKAMGYDVATADAAADAKARGNAVPPPPKPRTIEDLDLEALSALEACVVARASRRGVTPAMEKDFKTFQGIKARVLRPGTPGEGEVATSIALQRIVKMVFAN